MSAGAAPAPAMLDVLALGEAMIEFNQAGGGERTYLQGYGGDTSNAAIAAARQGARSGYLSRVGDDEFGRMLRTLWRSEDVDDGGVATDPDAHTGVYFVTHGPDGHAFSYLRAGSAASRLSPSALPLERLSRTRWLHLSGISQAISASACDASFAAIDIARGAGAFVSYDPNLRLRLWPLARARATIVETMRHVDLFLPSVDEARVLSGLEAPEAIVEWALARGARRVALKLGADGCLVGGDGPTQRVPGVAVPALDATGAGDCFDGALLARLVAGDALAVAARYANAAAALSTLGHGAVAPIPRVEQVRALLGC